MADALAVWVGTLVVAGVLLAIGISTLFVLGVAFRIARWAWRQTKRLVMEA